VTSPLKNLSLPARRLQNIGGSAAFGAARQLRTHDLCLAVTLNGLKHYQNYCPLAEA
jgi:hypothetical protein